MSEKEELLMMINQKEKYVEILGHKIDNCTSFEEFKALLEHWNKLEKINQNQQNRIDKAIEYMVTTENNKQYLGKGDFEKVLQILKGELDKEENEVE